MVGHRATSHLTTTYVVMLGSRLVHVEQDGMEPDRRDSPESLT